MKTYQLRISTIMMMAALTIFFACQPDNDAPDLEEPLAIKPTLLSGTWTAQKVVQYDQEALDNGFPEDVQSHDLTSMFPFDDYKIKFNLDAQGRPATYEVTPGDAPNFLKLNSGMWTLDHPVFATVISMNNTADVNSAFFRIKQLEKDVIKLQVLRNDAADSTLYSYYEYEFVKSN